MKRKRFIVWFHRNLANEITEMCGSDSIQNFDNSKSNETVISETKNPGNNSIEWMRSKGAVGFKIVGGTISDYQSLTELIEI